MDKIEKTLKIVENCPKWQNVKMQEKKNNRLETGEMTKKKVSSSRRNEENV